VTRRATGSDLEGGDLRLSDGEVVDLRDAGAPLVADRSRPPTLLFLDLLSESVLREEALLDEAIDLCSSGHVPVDETGDPRIGSWCRLLDVLTRLGARSAYVGTFKLLIDESVSIAAELPNTDRPIAARVVLDRTAALASSARDFRTGVLGARAMDATSVAPRVVIDTVLRPCLRYAAGETGRSTVSYGLSVTLAVLASGNGQAITADDMWALRAAIASVPASMHEPLVEQAQNVSGQDRRIIDMLLRPDHKRSFWRRRDRYTWESLEESLRRRELPTGH